MSAMATSLERQQLAADKRLAGATRGRRGTDNRAACESCANPPPCPTTSRTLGPLGPHDAVCARCRAMPREVHNRARDGRSAPRLGLREAQGPLMSAITMQTCPRRGKSPASAKWVAAWWIVGILWQRPRFASRLRDGLDPRLFRPCGQALRDSGTEMSRGPRQLCSAPCVSGYA
jgi:hypothetical protein